MTFRDMEAGGHTGSHITVLAFFLETCHMEPNLGSSLPYPLPGIVFQAPGAKAGQLELMGF